jgi:hypothetical protein
MKSHRASRSSISRRMLLSAFAVAPALPAVFVAGGIFEFE